MCKLILFTVPFCGNCNVMKQKLKEKDLDYIECNVTKNEENRKLAEKYNITMAGTLINTETGDIVEL